MGITFFTLARPDYGKFLQKRFQNVPKTREKNIWKGKLQAINTDMYRKLCIHNFPAIAWESGQAPKGLLGETEVWQLLAFLHRDGGHCSDSVWSHECLCGTWSGVRPVWQPQRERAVLRPGPRATPRGVPGQRPDPRGEGGTSRAGGAVGAQEQEAAPLGNGVLLLHLREPLVQADAGRGAGAVSQLRFLWQTGIDPWLWQRGCVPGVVQASLSPGFLVRFSLPCNIPIWTHLPLRSNRLTEEFPPECFLVPGLPAAAMDAASLLQQEGLAAPGKKNTALCPRLLQQVFIWKGRTI